MEYSKGLRAAVAGLCFILFTGQGLMAPAGADALYSGHNWKTFAKLSQAQAPIVFERVDLNLLSAAIFHETNRQRANNRLPALGFDTAARRAADLQAQI